MKTTIPTQMILALCALVPATSMAVTTAHCPDRIAIEALYPVVTKTVPELIKDTMAEDYPEVIEALAKSVQELEAAPQIYVDAPLVTAKNGRCVYLNKGSKQKIEISTSKGQNTLYFQESIGTRGHLVRIYMNGVILNEEGLEIRAGRKAIYLAVPRHPYTDYSAGGSMVKIGYADEVGLR